MITRITLILVFLLMICAEGAGNLQSSPFAATFTQEDGKVQFPPEYVPSGRQMYKEYCAACHGSDGKGRGPVATSLRKSPPNLTTLARAHGGNFPREYVANVLRFGPAIRLTVRPRCRCGDPFSSTLKTTMSLRSASASRICAIISSRYKINDREDRRESTIRPRMECKFALQTPGSSQILPAGSLALMQSREQPCPPQ